MILGFLKCQSVTYIIIYNDENGKIDDFIDFLEK